MVAERARREHRQRDVGRAALRRGDEEVAERELGDVELGALEGAAEEALELAGLPFDLEAGDAHAAVEERPGAVEVAERAGQFHALGFR